MVKRIRFDTLDSRVLLAFVFSMLVVCSESTSLHAEDAKETGNRTLQEGSMELPDINGETVSVPLGPGSRITVLCFLGTECPLAELYGPRLQKMSEEFSERVQFYGVNSNLHDSLEEFARYAKQRELTFPCLKDYENKLADRVGAERTPEVIVLDKTGMIRYQGRVDDQYLPGIARPAPSRHDLKLALEELVAGKPVSVPRTEAVGCLIGKVFPDEITTELTYSREVSRILQRHCVECHRSGEIGPFSLTEYDEVVGWGEMMLEVVEQKRMPPWHANPHVGEFANARGMSSEEISQLKEWVRGGMPYGDAANLPEPREYVDGWHFHRKPDFVTEMHRDPFHVPKDGIVEYQYFVVDPGFEEDKWVTGAQIVPGNREVVHHCIVFVRPPDGEEFRGLGWIAGYVPGQRSAEFPEGYARRVPAGSQFVFQMHYTTNGTAQDDLTKMGLLFIDEEEVTHEVSTLLAINHEFEIPPHTEEYKVAGSTSRIPERGKLLAITPHMHYRGKTFRVKAHHEGQQELLLDVPRYDFNWQHIYELAQPLPLREIDKLTFSAGFDNSSDNPFNPDPTSYVTWGDQSNEEMAIAFFEIAYPKGAKPREQLAKRNKQANSKQDPEQEKKVNQFVHDFFSRFDKNNDQVITRDELPLSMRRFGFQRFDLDNNGQLDQSEVKKLAKRSGVL